MQVALSVPECFIPTGEATQARKAIGADRLAALGTLDQEFGCGGRVAVRADRSFGKSGLVHPASPKSKIAIIGR